MGKPYAGELAKLGETYAWACQYSVESLAVALASTATTPLIAIGSGGSLSAAHLAADLHQRHAGAVSRAMTPLEFTSSALALRSAAVLIISAGGSNSDVTSAFENAIAREPARCIGLCLRKPSRLSHLASSYGFVDLFEANSPAGRDGFLATNSLLAFSVLLVRAYEHAFSAPSTLPPTFDELLSSRQNATKHVEGIRAVCKPLWKRETIVVLYGPSVASAALDIESKFSEAALASVQLADFRNFAHGRHHWLAKRGSTTGVLAMFAADEQRLAESTLRLIPRSIPIARIAIPAEGTRAVLAGLATVLHVVGFAGEARGIDPGRPGVPMFGRRIYGLRVARVKKDVGVEDTAIARKLGRKIELFKRGDVVDPWREAFRSFVRQLEATSFGAILFDYDGTLCDPRDRFRGIREDVARHLMRLLEAGVLVGVATGRGKSVREDLRKAVPRQFWKNVHVAYYNGADTGDLSDDACPDASPEPTGVLKAAAAAISSDPVIVRLATIEPRRLQISVQPHSQVDAELIWRALPALAETHGLRLLTSSHSIDIVAAHISKRSLLKKLDALVPRGSHVLLIGDKGQWPGNDYDLLAAPYALSVDEVSARLDSCWNVAPAGYRGVQATLAYLNAITVGSAQFKIHIAVLARRKSSRRMAPTFDFRRQEPATRPRKLRSV